MNDLFATIYQFFYYDQFSDDIYSEELYSPLGLIAILGSLFFVCLFYYIINRPSFSRWYHWLLILVTNFIIQLVIGIYLPLTAFSALNLGYQNEYYIFGLMNAIIASLFFILMSFLLRWWSTNAKRTPIPN